MRSTITKLTSSNNFDFLEVHDRELLTLVSLAEKYYNNDPNTSLMKLRQFGERMVQIISIKKRLIFKRNEEQKDLINRLYNQNIIPKEIYCLFHKIRMHGNKANHKFLNNKNIALENLKYAYEISIWFHNNFYSSNFQPPDFVVPGDQDVEKQNNLQIENTDLKKQIDTLKLKLSLADKKKVEDLDKLQKEIENLKLKLSLAQSSKNYSSDELEDLKQKYNSLINDLNFAKNQSQSLTQKLIYLNQKEQQINQELSIAKNQNEKYQQEVSLAKSQNGKYKNSLIFWRISTVTAVILCGIIGIIYDFNNQKIKKDILIEASKNHESVTKVSKLETQLQQQEESRQQTFTLQSQLQQKEQEYAQIQVQYQQTVDLASKLETELKIANQKLPQKQNLIEQKTPQITTYHTNHEEFKIAVQIAQEAAISGKKAKTAQEWSLIAEKWQKAAKLMGDVSPESSQYETAKNRYLQYSKNFQVAKAYEQKTKKKTVVLSTPLIKTYNVRFNVGSTGATVKNPIQPNERHRYHVWAAAGQELLLQRKQGDVNLTLISPQGQTIASVTNGQSQWSGKLSSTGNYIIEVSATSQSNYLISMNISALMQKKATQLIEKWLNAKQRMLAAPYDQQLVAQLATGKKLKDTIDSIQWLKSNSAYYEYEFSKLESLEYVKSSPGKAVFDATVVEKMTLYINGKIDKGNTTDYPRSKKYRFYLTFDQGFWKIEDSNYLSSE
ncbi:Type I restriction enzyme EcoKI R protein [Planktothrix tepida]|uniref:DUF4145 domain-containing protein n=1 Tax=Planktothrix tepida PCC 9214 TaxID=671072 RepID=A0A1J1LW55_9CYAN|nr:ARC6/PARC6 family protein [Planktothrix tepida]CAD5977135.1 Type I restriction enzyme EcoKI R protein [Planktothrix tepida]CUR35961.1 hypothetical protein PL921480071 [Planktothrix tepida PCC 9214]